MTKKQEKIVEKYVEDLKNLYEVCGGDSEIIHDRADRLLLNALRELGFGKLADAWEECEKKCDGFYYA